MEFLKILFNSVIVILFLLCVVVIVKMMPKEEFVYKDEKLKIKQIKKIPIDKDTITIYEVKYREKDYLITK